MLTKPVDELQQTRPSQGGETGNQLLAQRTFCLGMLMNRLIRHFALRFQSGGLMGMLCATQVQTDKAPYHYEEPEGRIIFKVTGCNGGEMN